jgi:hypothetical protein
MFFMTFPTLIQNNALLQYTTPRGSLIRRLMAACKMLNEARKQVTFVDGGLDMVNNNLSRNGLKVMADSHWRKYALYQHVSHDSYYLLQML